MVHSNNISLERNDANCLFLSSTDFDPSEAFSRNAGSLTNYEMEGTEQSQNEW
jgi:hypothetical protein